MRLRANGGIYCIIPIGSLYDESLPESIRWRLRKYLGVTIKNLTNEELNNVITLWLVGKLNNIFSKQQKIDYTGVFKSASERAERFFSMIGEDISMSFGYAIYHNGVQVGHDFAPSSKSQYDNANPSDGAKQDLSEFFRVNSRKSNIRSALNKKGWAIMLGVAHYMAARTEATGAYPDSMYPGYGKMVLMDLAMAAAYDIRTSLGRKTYGDLQYGYILSRRGWEGRQYRVI